MSETDKMNFRQFSRGKQQGQMKIQDQVRIVASADNASIAINEDGTIYVGSIRLTRQEAADYPALLAEAMKRTLAVPVSGKPE